MNLIKCKKRCNEISDKESKKNTKIFIFISLLLVFSIILLLIIINNIVEKKNLNACYIAIAENYDYDEFKRIVSNNAESFYNKAYAKLNLALEENNNKVKNGELNLGDEDFEKALNLLNTISKDNSIYQFEKEIIEKKKRYFNYYNYYNCGNTVRAKGDSVLALNNYYRSKSYLKGEDTTLTDEVNRKISSIKEVAYHSLKSSINKYMEEKNIKDGYKYIHQWDKIINDSTDEELKILYKQLVEENTKIENKENEEALEREKARRKSRGVTIGMTKQQVLDSSWGEPQKINTSIGIWGTHEQWVYGNGNFLYFDNGKLTSIQN